MARFTLLGLPTGNYSVSRWVSSFLAGILVGQVIIGTTIGKTTLFDGSLAGWEIKGP